MALIFMDGFDKYGGLNTMGASAQALMAGEWSGSAPLGIVAGLSSTGFAIQTSNGSAPTKSFPSLGRLIGGIRFSTPLTNFAGISFLDGNTRQAGIRFVNPGGQIAMYNGNYNGGTQLGISTVTISGNTTHYIEWDITFSNTGLYSIWLDGALILTGSGDTTATANNSVSGVIPDVQVGSSATTTWDDFYLFDSTGTTNNAPLLNNPRIETTFPVSDNTVQFSLGRAMIGFPVQGSNTTSLGATFYLRKVVPTVSCTLTSISILPGANSGSQIRGILYADNGAGTAPAGLLGTGNIITGLLSGVEANSPLVSSVSLTAGTQYWIGYMVTTDQNWFTSTGPTGQGYRASVAFGTPPSSAPTMTSGQISICVWGYVTPSPAVNYFEVSQQPPPGSESYLQDSTIGHEDLYNFGSLSVVPNLVHAVAVKGYMSRSDSGARYASLRTSSGGVDSGGSLQQQALAPSTFNWYSSYFLTDPNTGLPWTGPNLNSAQSGVRIDSPPSLTTALAASVNTMSQSGDVLFGGGDPYWTNTVLACHFDEANGSTTFIDTTGKHTVTAGGTAGTATSTAQFKFGTGSLLVGTTISNNGRATTPTSADFQFGSGQFTVECWCYPTVAPSTNVIGLVTVFGGSGNLGWFLGFVSGAIAFYYSTTGSDNPNVGVSYTPTLNQWMHVAADRDASNTIRVYANGVVMASSVVASTFFNSTQALCIGDDNNFSRGFAGYIDDVRITKGIARYAGAFTPPLGTFPDH